ncbi:MAG: YceI family protein [Crocinitomicaceae bacterium]|jgi:polyisoprenoid-binding protein YceI|nr:YceI family protein [Crocinitomicaceae bacterium]
MKNILLVLLISAVSFSGQSQIKTTQTAFVSFYSELEEVLAENYSGISELNTETGKLIFSFAIQSFMFENATMQKHFNEEDVMHSREFPRAKFVGSITDHTKINYAQDGEYKVNVKGSLTIKGVTNPIETKAIIKVDGTKIYANATFKLDRFLYGVDGKEGSISDILDLTVKAEYE